MTLNPNTTGSIPATTLNAQAQIPSAFFREEKDQSTKTGHKPHTNRDIPEPLLRKSLLCRNCLGYITDIDKKISIGGSHVHSFINPAEIVFNIGCFNEAQGCSVYGKETIKHTWFPGHTWCYAYCSSCGQHVGWYFNNTEGIFFFGLILKCLYEQD